MTKSELVNSKRHCMVVHAHYPRGETRVQRQAEALVRHDYEVDVLCLRGKREAATEFCNGVRVILDFHDLMPEFYRERYRGDDTSLSVRLLYLQEKLSCRFADHVITVSEHWRQALIERGVPAHKCSVVMNVADDNIFRPLKDDLPRSPSNSELQMIYHGTLVDRYGLDLAIRAVDQVRHDLPNIHLTILGKGSHITTLTQLIQELDLEKHVALRDEMRLVEELPEIIRAAVVGVVP